MPVVPELVQVQVPELVRAPELVQALEQELVPVPKRSDLQTAGCSATRRLHPSEHLQLLQTEGPQ